MMSPGTFGTMGRLSRSTAQFFPAHYARRFAPSILSSSTAAGRRTLVTPEDLALELDGFPRTIPQKSIDLDVSGNWDSSYTSYATASNRAGKNIYLYATVDGLILSPNSTVPTGYTANNSRKICGLHGLCLSVGTISGHALSGFLTGDILPASVWDLIHRPIGLQPGTVYCDQTNLWWMIYLQSGTGVSTSSAFGATVTDTRTWINHSNDLATIGMRLPFDYEFQVASRGSNQQTNIYGSSDPVTTGGHVDTSSVRMISSIGLEDCCGVFNQFLQDQAHKILSMPDTGDPSFSWSNAGDGGAYGAVYAQTAGVVDVKLLAGGAWNNSIYCGSRCRSFLYSRNSSASNISARGCCKSA